jgi:peptide/nickel transport system substrate-binding protein
VNDLNAAGIPRQVAQHGARGFLRRLGPKKLRGLFMVGAGNSGNAATRVESFIQSKGAYAYGGYPDIDALFEQVMYAPVMDLRALMGVGPRITKHTITDVWMSPFPSYEDMEIKGVVLSLVQKVQGQAGSSGRRKVPGFRHPFG